MKNSKIALLFFIASAGVLVFFLGCLYLTSTALGNKITGSILIIISLICFAYPAYSFQRIGNIKFRNISISIPAVLVALILIFFMISLSVPLESSKEVAKPSLSGSTNATTSNGEYGAGTYKIGVDMPAGEYVLFADAKLMPYVKVSSDSSIIDNDDFDVISYVSVKDGEYLYIVNCSAREQSSVKSFESFNNGIAMYGTYKVGKDIQPGEHKIKLIDGFSSGYFEIDSAPIGSSRQIISNGTIVGDTYVTLQSGQYIKLQDCFISLK